MPKTPVKSRGFDILILVEVWRFELQASSTRNWRATNCATPRFGDFMRFFCKWSNMWSDLFFETCSAFGRAEKVSVFKGFGDFTIFLRLNR